MSTSASARRPLTVVRPWLNNRLLLFATSSSIGHSGHILFMLQGDKSEADRLDALHKERLKHYAEYGSDDEDPSADPETWEHRFVSQALQIWNGSSI